MTPSFSNGLPLEIYCFCADPAWVAYEALQAELIEHLIAKAPDFDLEIFQNPSGQDFARAGM